MAGPSEAPSPGRHVALSATCARRRAVIDGDREINLRELRIDEECLKMLALYQPTARDLRFMTATMKIIND